MKEAEPKIHKTPSMRQQRQKLLKRISLRYTGNAFTRSPQLLGRMS